MSKVLGMSLGKINYCLKALKEKGLVKWGNFSTNPVKKQYMHILTPSGMSEKINLSTQFLSQKLKEYEKLKLEIEVLQAQERLRLINNKEKQ
jgi:EPS-associated MarR family transcriptional regulator